MRKKLIIVGILLILNGTVFCQHSNKPDSTRNYHIQVWQLDILLDIVFYDYPAALKTIQSYITALDSIKASHSDLKKVVVSFRKENEVLNEMVENEQGKALNREDIHKHELKTELTKGRKQGAAFSGIIGLILLVLLL